MAVRIHLDNPHTCYTNLDFISGKVILSLGREEPITAITVKLEGESSTTLTRPPPLQTAHGRPRGGDSDVVNENHKILYKVLQVFPPPGSVPTNNGLGSGSMSSLGGALGSLGGGTSFTLRAGQHEYPFNFKIPFNNMCQNQQAQMKLELGTFFSRDLTQPFRMRHIKTTLPPSLSGFPGEAEIKYFLKATVQRPSLLKENHRSQVLFQFQPIEPPRPEATTAEAFARRAHTFPSSMPLAPRQSLGFFSSRGSKPQATLSNTPPQILVDARLPNPAILTCNKQLPLRILTKKQSNSPESVFLTGLQIDLFGTTEVRAGEMKRTEHNVWNIVILNGLNRPIGQVNDPVETETPLDSALWQHIKLPETVTPSFNVCNLTRTYELEVKVTIGLGTPGSIHPSTQTLPLRFPVEVYSGIAPSPSLLAAMAMRPTTQPHIQPPIQPPRPQTQNTAPPPLPARPVAPTTYGVPPTHDPLYPPQLSADSITEDDAPPPSYEDALLADNIAPVDGAREFSGVAAERSGSTSQSTNPPSRDGKAAHHTVV